MDSKARQDTLEKVSIDLLSIPPLIFRQIRRKVIKTTLSDLKGGITLHQFEIIRLLENEGNLHIAEIGDRLHIARAQMTQLIDKLARLRLVERHADMTDRRTTIVTLSGHGKSVWKEHKASVMHAVQETVSQLPDEDLRSLSDTLEKLQEILSRLR
ncbi:MAG: MarR family winged helix-turn-helix transcriptional regulator [Dehalococcoidia bacterium]